jgi:RNA polymerase sigma factor (sigma-70 family)
MRWEGVHALVRRAQQGDESAWGPLFALVQPYLLGLAGQLLGPDWPGQSVSDLAQDTWLRAWRALSTFSGGESDADTGAVLRAWLGQIMRNVWRNDVRAAGAVCRKPPAGTPVPLDRGAEDSDPLAALLAGRDPTPSSGLHEADRQRRVREALGQIDDPTDREVVRRYFFEGQSLTRIAGQLGVSLDRVRQGFHRSLRRLRTHLDGLQ